MQEVNNSSNLGTYFALDQLLNKILVSKGLYDDFSVLDVIHEIEQEKSNYAIIINQQ